MNERPGPGEGTAPDPPGEGADGGDAAAYVEAIEQRFRELCEAPLMLSPADFVRVLRWHADGVPLFLVLQVLDELTRRARERRPDDPPTALAYYERAVRAAFKGLRERRVGGRTGVTADPDAAARYEEAAAAVLASRVPEPARGAVAQALRGLAGAEQGALLDPVGALAHTLVDAALATLSAAERAALDAQAQADVAAFAGDMQPDVRARAEASARARRVRARFAIPDLALLPPP